MIRKYIRKLRIGLLLALAFVCAALGLLLTRNASVVTFAEEQAAEESVLTQKSTPTSEALAYQALGRVNYVNTSACREITTINERYEGISGKTAVKRDMVNRTYQLYFDNCLEAATTYELSFYVKTLGAGSSFYGDIYYMSNSVSGAIQLPVFKKAEGEWVKYSCTFTVNENAEPETVETLFKLTITLKNTFTEAYLDAFSLVRADDGYSPILCGEAFSVADWQAGVDDEGITSFNGEEYPAAYKLSTESLISNYVATETRGGDFWLRFALQRTAGASVSFSIKNIVGEEIAKVDLTEEFAYYEFAITALEGHDFVCVQFDADFEDEENDYAIIGSFEWIEHEHELEEPGYDASCCTTTTRCSVCEMSLVVVEHDFLVTKEARCDEEGERVCQNAACGLIEALPCTAHTYEGHCSAENAGVAFNCTVCSGTLGWRQYMAAEHDMQLVEKTDGTHTYACSVCGYEEQSEHTMSRVEILVKPTATERGYAATVCEACNKKHGLYLPCVTDTSTEWTKTVLTEETCLTTGLVRYTLKAAEGIYVEYVIEALGHDYEAIQSNPTCTESGATLHHKCKTCGYMRETAVEVTELSALGHELSEWVVITEPTLESDGLRRKYCSRCQELVEEEVIPKLDEVNYTKYALDDHDENKGFYYYYENADYGTYAVFVEGTNEDGKVVLIIGISCAVVLAASVTAYCVIATKARKKKE